MDGHTNRLIPVHHNNLKTLKYKLSIIKNDPEHPAKVTEAISMALSSKTYLQNNSYRTVNVQPFPKPSLIFMTLGKRVFENIVGKCWQPAFSPFLITFSIIPKTETDIFGLYKSYPNKPLFLNVFSTSASL